MENIENNIYDTKEQAIGAVYKSSSELAVSTVNAGIGGPFGAGIIKETEGGKFQIISIASNSVLKSEDPTCHAEVNAIRKACKKVGSHSMAGYILVTTAKSCPMCLSAAIWADIKEIYYSESYDSATTASFRDDAIAEYIKGNDPDFVKEVQVKDPVTIEPFKAWLDKTDRVQY